LQTLIPISLLLISLIILGVHQLLRASENDQTDALLRLDPIGRFVKDEDFKKIKQQDIVTYKNRPRWQSSTVTVELLLSSTILSIHIAALATDAWGKHGENVATAHIVLWLYIVGLVSLRFMAVNKQREDIPSIWFHTTILYVVEWLPTLIMLRSQMIRSISHLSKSLTIAYFCSSTLLTIIALSTRIGNKSTNIEHVADYKPTKEYTASIFSILSFSWCQSMIIDGYKTPLQMKRMWDLMPGDKAAMALAKFRIASKRGSLFMRLVWQFKGFMMLQWLLSAFGALVSFVPIIMVKQILQYMENPHSITKSMAWLYVILLLLAGLIYALFSEQGFYIGRRISTRLKCILMGEIFSKTLKRKFTIDKTKVLGQGDSNKKQETKSDSDKTDPKADKNTEGNISSGAILNLMSADSFKLSIISTYLHVPLADAPVQLAIALTLLALFLGKAAIIGGIIVCLYLPLNIYLTKLYAANSKKVSAATDARITSINELLSNIRIVKYFAWEPRFYDRIEEKRNIELGLLRRKWIYWSILYTIFGLVPDLVTFFTFFYITVIQKQALTPSIAFPALALFQNLRIPMDTFASYLPALQDAYVSLGRIQEYLEESETTKYDQLEVDAEDDNGESIIGFENSTLVWDLTSLESFRLIEIDVRFKVGKLNVIVGPTGSGKTSLLMALLGEMNKVDGRVFLPNSINREQVPIDPETGLTNSTAYCGQQAWLINGTIKENILFASEFNQQRYDDVIQACSLTRDLEILVKKDQTLVGEKGIQLSGGQKQRISLARALYCRARHLLLDDVLSAVDSPTASWIFEKAINGPLMRHRTCILVTHNISLCAPNADLIVVLEKGRIVTKGTFQAVMDSGKLGSALSKPASQAQSRSGTPRPGARKPLKDDMISKGDTKTIEDLAEITQDNEVAQRAQTDVKKSVECENPKDETVPEEAKAEGALKWSVFVLYLSSMGGIIYLSSLMILYFAEYGMTAYAAIWIRNWSNLHNRQVESSALKHEHFSRLNQHIYNPVFATMSKVPTVSSHRNDADAKIDDTWYLLIFGAISLLLGSLAFIRMLWVFSGSLSASQRIHRQLLSSMLHAKFIFFDKTPIGQIINRFSKDIQNIDSLIAPIWAFFMGHLCYITIVIGLVVFFIPKFLIAALFMAVIYVGVATLFMPAARDLSRLESTSRSPIFQLFGETLSGVATIRAYGDSDRFARDNNSRVDGHGRPYMALRTVNGWLSFWTAMVACSVNFFGALFVVLSVGKMDPGAAGIVLSYSLSFASQLRVLLRLYGDNQQYMNGVERIKEYIEVDQEAPAIVENVDHPADWPAKGSVEFVDYSTRYREDLDLVLKNVNFKIDAGQKIGVVGRTGAGKSSLALALFRALEAENGKIMIDDVDVSLVGLKDLRENVIMVPQGTSQLVIMINSFTDVFL